MTPTLEQLREALEQIRIHSGGPARDSFRQYWFMDDREAAQFQTIFKAACDLLRLQESHPNLEGLIKGTHCIAENLTYDPVKVYRCYCTQENFTGGGDTPDEAFQNMKAVRDAAIPICPHEWVSADNEYVEGVSMPMSICLKCKTTVPRAVVERAMTNAERGNERCFGRKEKAQKEERKTFVCRVYYTDGGSIQGEYDTVDEANQVTEDIYKSLKDECKFYMDSIGLGRMIYKLTDVKAVVSLGLE